jgi:ankyrin repeat protein
MGGDKISVLKILKENPGVDVNCADRNGTTVLYWACFFGFKEVVSLLLAHPNIDVNGNDNDPAVHAAVNKCTDCFRMMLQDPRVEITGPGNIIYGFVVEGGYEMLRWWVATGR